MRRAVGVAVALVLLAACSGGAGDGADGRDGAPVEAGGPGLGPLDTTLVPSVRPVQAGAGLAGDAVPTNQWWASALTGPWTQPLWAMPIVARAGPDGLALAAPTGVRSTADTVTTDVVPQITVGGSLAGVEVVGYGSHSVTLALARTDGSPLEATLAQGAPLVHLAAPAGELRLAAAGPITVDADDQLVVTAAGRTWRVVAPSAVAWDVAGDAATATLDEPAAVTLAPVPDGAGAAYLDALAAAATRAITGTTSTLTVDRRAGTVRQHLGWDGTGPGLVATLPHHRLAGAAAGLPVLGTFPTARGDLEVVAASSLDLETPVVDASDAVPDLDLDGATTDSLAEDLARDLDATTPGLAVYDDAKALGRLALLADIAARLPGTDDAVRARQLLRTGLLDWLTYSGPHDARWLAYEPTWGGIAAHPPQFGSQDYNDHHFHFGYLVRAAATLARLAPGADDGLDATATGVVDLLVADIIGTDGTGPVEGAHPLPSARVWNAYLGHSQASGFVPFADGGNQESSSEAVHAWQAVASWGRATDRPSLAEAGAARATLEALSARTYWLGELAPRPAGYGHEVAGIVWDGKVELATFFDPRPEAAIGIQLLPFTPASTYRSDRGAAARRVAAARTAGGGQARLWPDLFLMEEALADPTAALAGVDAVTVVEAGNSRTWMRWWILSQQRS